MKLVHFRKHNICNWKSLEEVTEEVVWNVTNIIKIVSVELFL